MKRYAITLVVVTLFATTAGAATNRYSRFPTPPRTLPVPDVGPRQYHRPSATGRNDGDRCFL